MHHKLKQEAIYLRTKLRLSYSAILRRVPVSKGTLSVWLQPFPLSREEILKLRREAWGKNEAKIELFRATMREKRRKQDIAVYKKYRKEFRHVSKLAEFTSGLILYLAEGSKTNTGRVALANTDPRVCRFFTSWLIKFYKVPKSKIRVHLQMYPTMNLEKETTFWGRELDIPKGQFYKPFVRKLSPSSFSYQESYRHGTCTVMVLGVKIQREVMMAVNAYINAIS